MKTIMAWLNWQTVSAGIRQVAQWGSGLLAANGLISADQSQLLVGAVMSVAVLAWSFIEAKSSNGAQAVKKAVQASPVEVKEAVIDAATTEKKRTTIIDVLKKSFN